MATVSKKHDILRISGAKSVLGIALVRYTDCKA